MGGAGWVPGTPGADWFWATDADVGRAILQRGTAAVFAIAFWAAWRQFRPLLGERGLAPVPAYVARTTWRRGPSLFRLRYSDRLLTGVCLLGLALALAVVAGLPQSGPWWLPMLVFLILWAGYLSVVNVGQTFYAFGWESLLCELGFLVAFLGSDDVPAPLPIILGARWLLFRLEFGAGLIKLRGDSAWRDLTALNYHHETQPLPGPLSAFAHQLPPWWHRAEVVGNHIAQVVVPFGLFAPQPVASVAGGLVVLTQAWLVLTGNFAWLNWLAIMLGLAAVGDDVWASLWRALPDAVGQPAPPVGASAAIEVGVVGAVTLLLLGLSYRPMRNLFSRGQVMNTSFEPFRLVNAYGAFGTVSRRRYEVVVEGTLAEHPAASDWVEYPFRGKPGPPTRRPPQVAPYHLRLDWAMWFLALGQAGSGWFEAFCTKLLDADPATLALLRADPFAGERPRWVRARVFRYRFAPRDRRRAEGVWWLRDEVGVLVGPIGLRSR